ncbi:MAG: ABC transporter ATP-binding protein [Acidimicrobiia bacterium]
MSEPLLKVEGLKVHFPVYGSGVLRRQTGTVKAVDGVDFEISRGETLGLVGESGCGKSTTGLSLLRLVEPTAGSVVFDGEDLRALDRTSMRKMRRRMAMIFQDPFASLDPRMSVSDIVSEPIVIHGLASSRAARDRRVAELMEMVGLNPDYRNRYPHEFSGGQRQRVGIARALATEPDFIVCDEPIAALDVSIQAQIMNLMEELQDELGLTYLFIAHDLSAVEHFSDRIAVMYLGRIVETATRRDLAVHPRHPYTEALLSAVPVPDPEIERRRTRILLEGDVPSPLDPPSGCRFHTRCRYAFEPCPTEVPGLVDTGGAHVVACHLDGGTGLTADNR